MSRMSPNLAVYGLVQRTPERCEPLVWLPSLAAFVIPLSLNFPAPFGSGETCLGVEVDDHGSVLGRDALILD